MTMRPITEEDLNAYVDRLLDPEREAALEGYLAQHPEVAQRVAGYQRNDAALRAAFEPIAEEPVPPELSLARLMERRRRPDLPRWQAAAAAVLLLCVGGASGWGLRGMTPPAPEGMAVLAQEAADSYQVFAPDHIHPVEFRAADRSQLVDWASRQLRHTVAIPDLSRSGYRFMGGRLIATSHGAAVLLMYDDDHGTRLVMVSRPMAIEGRTHMSQHSVDAVEGFAWADKGIGYSLVGPVAPEVLHPLANEVRRQIDKDV
ncbi:MAG: anti-sigma factor [Acetobacteraceae bacterium]|nr:anti-sigma factor [Acetobacteraceae bacterium]